MTTRIEFIESIQDAANKASEVTGMSAELMIAQAVQETGWGQHVLANTNNIFNIKADSSWTGPTATFVVKEFIGDQWVTVNANFRVYATVEESLIDRVKFLQENPRYSQLFNQNVLGDFEKEANVLQQSGYATDPYYALNLSKVYNGPTMQGILKVLDSKTPDPSSAQQSLSNAISQGTTTTQKEQAAKEWFSTFSDSLDSWTGSTTNFMKESAKDVVNFFSGPSESLTKIGGWISSTFTNGKSDEVPNPSLINNSLLNLQINTSPTNNSSSSSILNNSLTQIGNVIDGGDYKMAGPINNINGNGIKNVVPWGIVSDYFNPGRQEQSTFQSFTKDYTKDINNLAASIYNSSASQSLWNSSQVKTSISNLTNSAIGARTLLNIDPVVLDLNGDGVKLTSYSESQVTFDVDNDNKSERTGWVSKEDGILVHDKNQDGIINNITETISEYYNTNDGSVANDDKVFF